MGEGCHGRVRRASLIDVVIVLALAAASRSRIHGVRIGLTPEFMRELTSVSASRSIRKFGMLRKWEAKAEATPWYLPPFPSRLPASSERAQRLHLWAPCNLRVDMC